MNETIQEIVLNTKEFLHSLQVVNNCFKKKSADRLSYVHFKFESITAFQDNLIIEATDSHILEQYRLTFKGYGQGDFKGGFLIDKNDLKALIKEVKTINNENLAVDLYKNEDGYYRVRLDEFDIYSYKDDNYPDLDKVIPNNFDINAEIDYKVGQLLPLLRQLKKEYKKPRQPMYIRLNIDTYKNSFDVVYLDTKGVKKYHITSIDTHKDVDAYFIDMNIQYLINCLNKKKLKEDIRLFAYSPMRPIKIISNNNISVLCPVRRFKK